jgi:hypothetical protein
VRGPLSTGGRSIYDGVFEFGLDDCGAPDSFTIDKPDKMPRFASALNCRTGAARACAIGVADGKGVFSLRQGEPVWVYEVAFVGRGDEKADLKDVEFSVNGQSFKLGPACSSSFPHSFRAHARTEWGGGSFSITLKAISAGMRERFAQMVGLRRGRWEVRLARIVVRDVATGGLFVSAGEVTLGRHDIAVPMVPAPSLTGGVV